MILLYALAFACGLLTKLTDKFLDEPFKSRHPMLPFATGIAYGLIAGFLITSSAEFATLVIAVTIGVLIAGKIDSWGHRLAVAAMLLFATFHGLPRIDFMLVGFFTLLGFLDELLNDFIDRLKAGKVKVNSLLGTAVNARLSLEIGAIAFGLYSGNFVYFLALFSFDLAYNLADKTTLAFVQKPVPEHGSPDTAPAG